MHECVNSIDCLNHMACHCYQTDLPMFVFLNLDEDTYTMILTFIHHSFLMCSHILDTLRLCAQLWLSLTIFASISTIYIKWTQILVCSLIWWNIKIKTTFNILFVWLYVHLCVCVDVASWFLYQQLIIDISKPKSNFLFSCQLSVMLTCYSYLN